MADLCLICKLTLNSGAVVQLRKKGIDKVIECSKKVNDNLWKNVLDTNQLRLHVKCRRDYTRESTVKSNETCASSSQRPQTRIKNDSFCFQTQCLFCEQSCESDKKSKRNVRIIATLEIKENIKSRCLVRNDEWSNKVLTRISTIADLVAAEARYHVACYVMFFREASTRNVGRPVDQVI